MSVTEIAQRAGVSIATVSRVLNHDPRVRPETARQVEQVLKEMPYDREAVRRGPRIGRRSQKRTGNLLVLAVGETQSQMLSRPLYAAVVAGLTRAARARNLNVLIDEMLDTDSISPILRSGGIDGSLAFVKSDADPQLLTALQRCAPVVRVLGEELPNPAVDQVRPDNLAIGQIAFHYLASRGRKNVAFATTRPDHEAFLLRGLGFALAADRAGASAPHAFVTGKQQTAAFTPLLTHPCESLEELADRIARSTPAIEGLFVSHDTETIGLYPMLVKRGIHPGRDITMVSCNNEIRTLSMLNPRPASIDIGVEEIGRWAVTRLVNRIARPGDPPVRLLVSPRLVEDQVETANLSEL